MNYYLFSAICKFRLIYTYMLTICTLDTGNMDVVNRIIMYEIWRPENFL